MTIRPPASGNPNACSTKFSPMVVDWMKQSSSGAAPTRAPKPAITAFSLASML